MFFKNAIIYQITQPAEILINALREAVGKYAFAPCGPHSAVATGFIPPFSEAAGLFREMPGAFLFRVKRQVKSIPPSAVNEMLAEKVDEIEAEQGRKVFRKERLNLKDEIILELLPTAIPTSKTFTAYIDTRLNMLLVDASSPSAAEKVLDFVRNTVGGCPVIIPVVDHSPEVAMTNWLRGSADKYFTPSSSCKLHNHDGCTITIKNEDLSSHGVEGLLNDGKVVQCLQVDWGDHKVRFTLHAPHIFKGIHFSEELIRDAEQDGDDELAVFDADMALMVGTFQQMIPQVGAAFGKWLEQDFLDLESA